MADIIKILVVMVFAYIIIKYQILPRIAAKKLKKQAETAQGQAISQTQAQGMFSGSPADLTALQTLLQCSSASPVSGVHVSCFDMRIIRLSGIGDSDCDSFERRITYAANEMLLKASTSGCRSTVPHLGILPFLDDALLLYIVYAV